MHAANAKKSKRLQATLRALRRSQRGCTTRQLARATGSVAPHSDVAEIRANGFNVSCTYEGTTPNGRRVYRYRLERR